MNAEFSRASGRANKASDLSHFLSSLSSAFLVNAYPPLTADRSSLTTGFRSIPIRSISTSQRSPAFIHSGGFRERPTPAGVPVTNTSPGTERDHLANERDLRGNIEDHVFDHRALHGFAI